MSSEGGIFQLKKIEICERCMTKNRMAKSFTYNAIQYTICEDCFYEVVDRSTFKNWHCNTLYAYMSVSKDKDVPW